MFKEMSLEETTEINGGGWVKVGIEFGKWVAFDLALNGIKYVAGKIEINDKWSEDEILELQQKYKDGYWGH